MGLLIREYVERNGRGKSRKIQVVAGFDYPGIFEIAYDPAKHRHFILRELRYRTGPAPAFSVGTRRNLKDSVSTSAMSQCSGKQQFYATPLS
jgi:hypothetical protein